MKQIGTIKLFDSKDIDQNFISIGCECADRGLYNHRKCYEAIGETGAKQARVQTGWAICEKEPGVYHFEWLDEMIDELLSRGVKPWLNLSYGNPIYMPDAPNPTAAGCTPILYGNEVMGRWLDFVRAVTKHYRNRVTHYEVWNEPNSSLFWHPATPETLDIRDYADFVIQTSAAVHEVDPEAKVGACIDGRGFTDHQWIDLMIPKFQPGDIQFFSFHIYAINAEYQYYPNIAYLRNLLDQNGLTDVEIWQGEGGFPSWFPEEHSMEPKSQSSEHEQAVGHLRRYFLDKSSGCALCSIFVIADMWEKAYILPGLHNNKPAAQGILNGLTYTKKKAHETMRRASYLFSGDCKPVRHSTPVNENIKEVGIDLEEPVRFVFERNGKPFYAYYLPVDVEASMPNKSGYTFTVETTKGESAPPNPVLIDMLNGEVYALEGQTDEVGNICYTDLPIGEYPFVICDATDYEIE